MAFRAIFASFCCVGAFLVAGCPLDSSATDAATSADSTGGRPAPSVGGTTADETPVGNNLETSAVGSSSDALTRSFPGCSEPENVASLRQTIFTLVNRERANNGVGPVSQNATLEAEATEYACEMIQYDYFAHVNPVTGSTLRDRALVVGYSYQVIGENLAAGQSTAERAFADWLASPSHRDNILDPRFTELGVGIRLGGDYGIYWVQEFGEPVAKK